MRLKDIKPGMAIYCTRRDQIAEIRKTGIRGLSAIDIEIYMTPPCYVIIHRNYATWEKDRENVKKLYPTVEICEFSDLVIPELTAEEVLKTFGVICDRYFDAGCGECPMMHDGECVFGALNEPDVAKKIVAICEQWKSDHEKKEPAFEWVNVCRIIRVHDNGKKECVEEIPVFKSISEGFAEWQLKEYGKEHEGDYIAVVERVCRVKK